jgi:hypothetical protein
MVEQQLNNPEIGRVLRASTVGFAVGCRVTQLEVPAFGALVKACPLNGQEMIYGLIYNMNVDDDPLVRRLVLAENPRTETINDQRSNRLLPIEMSVAAIGYGDGERIFHALPPRPPLNLDPVEMCVDSAEIHRFTESLGYLRLILSQPALPMPVDQLLVAHVLDMVRRRGDDRAWAMLVIGELIELLRVNYEVLTPVLEALSEALPELALTSGVGGF